MTKHSPGPWQLSYLLLRPDEVAGVRDANGWFIADCTTTARSIDEIAANCRLIAAAPDLLAACEAELEVYDGMDMATLMPKTIARIEALRAAIAKARPS